MKTVPVFSARSRAARVGSLLFMAACALATDGTAQDFGITGYGLGVFTNAQDSPLMPGGTGLIGRLRVMPFATLGDVVLDIAYEHVLTRTPEGGGIRITTPGGTASSTDWLDLGWTVRETDRTTWTHRFDRLALSFESGAFEVTAGRQAISWATTLFLTPADPFSPFDPSDPFRVYRGGVDALRIRTFPGPFSELEIVVRGANTPSGTTTTALLRGQTSVGGGVWSVGAWGGALHDEAAGAAFATGSVGATAVRAEASLREDPSGGTAVRVSAGVDRFFRPYDRDMYVVIEIQHDELAAQTAADLLEVLGSSAYTRGELQTLGANTLATQMSYQFHPLVSVGALGLINLNDWSSLASLSLSWSASGSKSVSLGSFLGRGDDSFNPTTGLSSEYGFVPRIVYASVSWFF